MLKKSMKKFSVIGILLVLTITLTLVAGCSSNKDTAKSTTAGSEAKDAVVNEETEKAKDVKTSKELSIYTALPDSEVPVYLNAFEKATGIKVNFVRLSAGEILAKLQVEKNNPQASVWYGGPVDTFISAKESDLLEKYESPELTNIPDEYKDPDGYYAPFYAGALGFAVNTEWFASKGIDYPATWEDLTKPEFKNEISIAHPGSSGTAYTILASIIQMYGEDEGWEYFKALNENIRQYTKSGSAPATNVGLGEAAIGLVFSHDGLKPVAEGYPVEVVFPEDGTGYEIGGIALVKNGPEDEMENAKIFIDWVLSKEGQELFEESKSFRLPVNVTATPPEGAINIDDLKTIDYDFIWAGENRDKLVEEFTEIVAGDDDLEQ